MQKQKIFSLLFLVILGLSILSLAVPFVHAQTTETIEINIPAWCPADCYVYATDNSNGLTAYIYTGETYNFVVNYGDSVILDGVNAYGTFFSYTITSMGIGYQQIIFGQIYNSFAITFVFASSPSIPYGGVNLAVMDDGSGGGVVTWSPVGNSSVYPEGNFTVQAGLDYSFNAVANSGWQFDHFGYVVYDYGVIEYGNTSINNPLTLNVTSSYGITAYFVPTSTGGAGSGGVVTNTVMTLIVVFALILIPAAICFKLMGLFGGFFGANLGIVLGFVLLHQYMPIFAVVLIAVVDAVILIFALDHRGGL